MVSEFNEHLLDRMERARGNQSTKNNNNPKKNNDWMGALEHQEQLRVL